MLQDLLSLRRDKTFRKRIMDKKGVIIGICQYSYKSEESFYKSQDWF